MAKAAVLVGNWGNDSVALAAYCLQQVSYPLHWLMVNTGWQSAGWAQRVKFASQWAKQQGIIVHELHPVAEFAALVQERGEFPSAKHSWCVSFLKGLPLLAWLDEHDSAKEYIIYGAARRVLGLRYQLLEAKYLNEDLYGGRALYYPLLDYDDKATQHLVAQTPLSWLPHQAHECMPCIFNARIESISLVDQQRMIDLEIEVGKTMFAKPYKTLLANRDNGQCGITGCSVAYGCCL